jgi:hypothetical protein
LRLGVYVCKTLKPGRSYLHMYKFERSPN